MQKGLQETGSSLRFQNITKIQQFCFIFLIYFATYKLQVQQFILLALMLSSASIFPTQQFLRYGTQPQANTNCGGIASLLVVGILLALFISKVIQTSRRQTIYLTQKNKYGFRPENVALTTNFSDIQKVPFMLAAMTTNYAGQQDQQQLEVNVTYEYYIGNKLTVSERYQMVTCTQEHFVEFEEMRQILQMASKDLQRFQCLPLDKNFIIGGDQNAYQYGKLSILVSPGANNTGKDGGVIQLFESNSLLDPSSQDQTVGRSFKTRFQNLQPKKKYQYQSTLKKQTLQSDQSLTPFADIKKFQAALLAQNLQKVIKQIDDQDSFQMEVDYVISTQSTLFKRSYYKYADIISYVGGYFSPIIALFFFMSYIGNFHFEMSFAKKYFRSKEGKDNSFWSYMKYNIFKIATALGLQLSWQKQKKQQQLRDITNRLLNIDYIFQRINFLQRAITMLFDQHHLKGLYLLHKVSISETKTAFKNHQYRDLIVKFLYCKRAKDIQDANKGRKSAKNKNRLKSKQGRKKDKKQSGQKSPPLKTMDSGLCYSYDRLQRDGLKDDNLDVQLPEVFPQIKLMTYSTQKESQKKDSFEDKLKEPEYLSAIIQEMEMIRDENFEETVDEEALKELRRDFRRLMEEAENRQGDQRSKRIYDSLDEYLKGLMKLEFGEEQRVLTSSLERSRHQ